MSAAKQPANKVLLRLVDPSLDSGNARQKASNYEVYLAKFHAKSGKHFYCNLHTKSTSWDAPADAVEVSADGADADAKWTQLQAVFAEVEVAEKKKLAFLEGLRPPRRNPDPAGNALTPTATAKANAEVVAVQKRETAKPSSKANAKLADAAARLSLSADASQPEAAPVAAPAPVAAATPSSHGKRVFVEWKKHKPEPVPPIATAQLQQALVQFGAIETAFIVVDRLAQKNQPYGFVEFKNIDSAERAAGTKKIQIGAVVANVSFAKGSN